MRILAIILIGTFGLVACARSEPGASNQVGVGTVKVQKSASGQFRYDRPVLPSMDGTSLSVAAVPSRWRRGAPGFAVRVTYRNAPPGAGLMLYVTRDVPLSALGNFPSSGGGLLVVPVPIEGDGVQEIRFDGTAILAPA